MDFSPKSSGNRHDYIRFGSGSDLQLVFVPGLFGPDIWKHQIKYFSEDYDIFTFTSRKYTVQKEYLEEILDREDTENVVIVSQGMGNSVAQEFEYREEVIAMVNTGVKESYSISPPRAMYNLFWNFSLKEPKIYKKLFFSDLTDYSVTRKFLDDIERPDYDLLRSFLDSYSVRKPVKNALVIHAEKDRFSSLKKACALRPNVSVSVIKNAGTFSFYEKPQEYNKALLDFLKNLEDFVESREISRTREKNRSLSEFTDKKTGIAKKPRIEK